MFCEKNINWIWKVGMSTFNKLSLSPLDYVKGLVKGTVNLDELALLIAARALNIHIVVLCKERYWSTRSDKSHEDCQVKLVFTGGHSFKKLTSKVIEDFDQSFEEDLQGTGLGQESESDSDSKSQCNCDGTCTCSDPYDASDNTLDDNASNGNDADSVMMLLSDDAMDLSAVVNAPVKQEPLDDMKQQSNNPPDAASTSQQSPVKDVIPFKMKCIERKDPYDCHVCLKQFEIQSSYVKHMQAGHPDEPLQCDKCNACYNSPNGLFKHIRSHRYMKYKCDVCQKHFQFPYQINDHLKTHTGSNLYPCKQCE